MEEDYISDYYISESSAVPESYRPLILISFGIWGWLSVLLILSWQRIDAYSLLYTTSKQAFKPLFQLAASISIIIFIGLILEHTIFIRHTNLFNHFGPVILCYGLVAVFALMGSCNKECEKFLKCLYRLFFKFHGQVYFSDVLVADILISFSGVFTGVFIKLMHFTDLPYSKYVPLVTSVPYMIRLRQCLSDYFASPKRNQRQLVNACKYLSAIPVIFLSHYTSLEDRAMMRFDSNEALLWRLWFVSAIISNLFAFGWDVMMDWGLIQIGSDHASIRLRKDIHFSDPSPYILGVGLNGLLRLLKVESHLHHIHPFCVDLSEIARRWLWVIFRFENEWIKRSYTELEERELPTISTA